MSAVNSYNLQRILLYKLSADVDKQLNILGRRGLAVTLARQLDVLALVPLDDGLDVEPVRVSQVDHQPNLDLMGFHRAEEHVRAESVLGGDLLVISLVQGGLESKEPRTHERGRLARTLEPAGRQRPRTLASPHYWTDVALN